MTRVGEIGCYLGNHYDSRAQDVLLPAKWMPNGVQIGDKIEVFVYKDSEDRPIATTMEPALTLGQTAVLRVVDTTRIGAFLDWGLEKDLLLPFHEQNGRLHEGDECLVTLYIDKSERLCASMKKVYHALSTDTPYVKDDVVDGFIYEISDEYGAYVAVDGKYSARIAPQEMRGALSAGRRITARVARVLPDGKMDLTLQKKVADQMTDDAEAVLSEIRARGGSLPFTDKADAEVIREAFGMSKNAFKRAVGRLLKQGKIAIDTDQIRMKS
ncbi:MAG: RNA-binding protein [Lachnospiraceae bacterium]|nr:RNA-binding protein [Lachnospiraceae bacterium]